MKQFRIANPTLVQMPATPMDGRLRAATITAIILLLATLATRLPWLGDPLYHEDEGFYLAFAKAMHQGAIPYVDLWDRKPMGLFLIYWLIGFVPGNSVFAYQAVAGFFAFGTAWTVSRIVRPLHGEVASRCAGIVYLACLLPLFGGGGQAPVFYNLFLALAALALMPSDEGRESARDIIVRGCTATLLCGLALTIKPTVVVESCFFGIVAAKRMIGLAALPLSHRMFAVAACALLGALSTLAILGTLAVLGNLESYWFATVHSLSLKEPQPLPATLAAARYLGIILLPFWFFSMIGWIETWRTKSSSVAQFLTGWAFAAIGGFLLVPSFWDHYAIPLLPPLTVMTAAIFARAGTGGLWAALLILWSLLVAGWPAAGFAQERQQLARLVQIIDRTRQGGCLYVYEGPAVLYALTGACRVTSRLFPQHLSLALERRAIGLDPEAEMHRILARRPAVVTMTAKPIVKWPNLATRRILLAALHRDYQQAATLSVTDSQNRTFVMEVWALKPPPSPLAISKNLPVTKKTMTAVANWAG